MEKTPLDNQEEKTSKLQWFLFAIIPLLVIIAATLIILMIADINVFEKAKEVGKKLPVVSQFMDEKPSKKVTQLEEKIIELEGQIRDREALVAQLESKLATKESEQDQFELEKEQLAQTIVELEAIQSENKRAFKDIVRTYETMSAKKAAPILVEMKSEDALQILSHVKADTLAAILEKMEPQQAAHFTALLAAKEAE